MKRRILSVALALCLFISSQSEAYAWQEGSLPEEDVLTEESIPKLAARDTEIPTPTEVYEAMIALKDRDGYTEGTAWTNDEPYSDSNGYYRWNGGPLGGANIVAVGCVAFAFILSDEAFGSLPARMYASNEFAFEDIKPGDILRMNNDVHTVIVLQVNDAGVVVAEGNNSAGDHKGKVHWGRAISKEEVMRDTSHYITRYPEGYIPPDDPEANVSIGNGTLDGGLTWNLTKAGTLAISGNGAMPDFMSAKEQPWNMYSSQIRKVVIGDGVTSIGSGAFWNCGVFSAEISPSVTTIGNNAFYSSSMISVTIPSSVKAIGDSAFQGCENLSSVTVSEGVETIGQNAFRATGLTSITLPASIGEVGAAAFFQCQKLESATFMPGSKKVTLGDNMFTQCYYLMNVTLPKSADRISTGMFQNCLMLPGVEIPQDAESIGESAFASCSALSTVIIPDSVTTIERSAFQSSSLSAIYFTGTETQWNSIFISPDVKNIISQAAMHYEYTPIGISNAEVTLEQTSYTYDGTAKTPAVTVELDGKQLVLNMDYTVSYSNNVNVGTAAVTVTGKAEYTGSKTVNFAIVEAGSGNGGNPGNGEGNGGTGSGDTGGNGSTGDNGGTGSGGTGGSGSTGDNGGTGSGDTGGNGSTGDNGGTGSGDTGGNGSTGDNGGTGGGDNSGSNGGSGNGGSQEPASAPFAKGKTFTISKVTYRVTKVGKEVELTGTKSTAKKVTVNTVTGTDGVKYKVTSIGPKAMQNNKKLVNLSIGDNVKTIGANAFSGCTKLTTVTIGKTSKSGLMTIGKSTFSGCKKLAKVTIKSTKLSFAGKQAFKDTKSGLKVKVPPKQLKKYKKILKKAGLKNKQVI